MCDYSNNERYLKLTKTSVICSFMLLIGCNFFEAKQQVFECKKTHIDGQPLIIYFGNVGKIVFFQPW